MNCEEARAAMDDAFSGAELGEREPRLEAHLKTCQSCSERYDRLARVDMVLERGGLSEQRMDALQARILGKVAPAPLKAPPLASTRAWRSVLAAAASAVLVAAIAVPVWRSTRDDGFTPRGGGTSWGVRAFCVQAGQVTAEAKSGETLTCAPGSLVQFTYTAPAQAQLSIALEGSGERFFPVEGERAQVTAGIDVSLPQSTPVGEWLTGPRKVTAHFTDASGKPVAESALTIAPPSK